MHLRTDTRKRNKMSDSTEETLPLKDKDLTYELQAFVAKYFVDIKGLRGHVQATKCSKVQAPVQCFFRPAMWIPGLRNVHSHKEEWETEGTSPKQNVDIILRALPKVIATDKTRTDFTVNKVTENFLRIFVFTRAEWLDIIEMQFEGNKIQISAFSSGFLPLIIPGACFLNLFFFWVPFFDMSMNEKRLFWIHRHLDTPVSRNCKI